MPSYHIGWFRIFDQPLYCQLSLNHAILLILQLMNYVLILNFFFFRCMGSIIQKSPTLCAATRVRLCMNEHPTLSGDAPAVLFNIKLSSGSAVHPQPRWCSCSHVYQSNLDRNKLSIKNCGIKRHVCNKQAVVLGKLKILLGIWSRHEKTPTGPTNNQGN